MFLAVPNQLLIRLKVLIGAGRELYVISFAALGELGTDWYT